ncbi:MAG: hypothetical protein MMC33_001743 [Icmadophila ericetorum]|nr:hypothetical protein [Icmadophila ericetorum]
MSPSAGRISTASITDKQRTSIASSLNGNSFLDFLYPAKTLALIQRLANTNATYLRTRAQFISSPYAIRAFTSRPSLAQEMKDGSDTLVDTKLTSTTVNEGPETRTTKFSESKDLEIEYQKAWERYQELELQSRGKTKGESKELGDELSSLVHYLKVQGAALKAERAVRVLNLFNRIDVDNRRSIHYDYAIQAALDLDDLEHATALHQEAVVRLQGSFGTASILRYSVEHENWSVAVGTWDTYWQHRKIYYGRPDIWHGVDSLRMDVLIEKALGASQWVLHTIEATSWDATKIIRDFSLQLILRTFSNQGTPKNLRKYMDLFNRMKTLTDSLGVYYNAAILQLLSIPRPRHSRLALELYNQLREDSSVVPSMHLLEHVISRLVKVRSKDILMAYEDVIRYHNIPSKMALELTISGMANEGNAEIVHALFAKYREVYGNPTKPYLYLQLLRVHERRGEINEVLIIFNTLQERYNYKPEISCWNMVLATYARISDFEGAEDWWERMLASDEKPTRDSFSTMATVYGDQGNTDALQDLLKDYHERGIKMHVNIVEQLVLAHIKNGDFEEAENLVMDAWEKKLPGYHTSMWNLLINGYGLDNRLGKVNDVSQKMSKAGVPRDEDTYSALMQSLCVAKLPSAAESILRRVMVKDMVRATSLHYSVVMQGYLSTGEPHRAIRLYDLMLREDVRSTFNSHSTLIKAAAELELKRNRRQRKGKGHSKVDSPFTFELAEEFLEQIFETIDPADIAPRQPVVGIENERLDEAHISSYFEYLIRMYGRGKNLEKVAQLFANYEASTQKVRPSTEGNPPLRMVSSLMTVYLKQGNYEEVERCWYLAMEKAEPFARRSTAEDLSQPDWVLPSKRTILNTTLAHYTKALVAQERISDIETTLEQLQVSGYEPDSRAWNNYIQGLVNTGQIVEAINLCEEKLISNFTWRKTQGLPSVWSRARVAKLQPKAWEKTKLVATYKTMILLASAYLHLRTEKAFAGPQDATMIDLSKSAPNTIRAILETPRINDPTQSRYLQRI